jgi:hypothetical protein
MVSVHNTKAGCNGTLPQDARGWAELYILRGLSPFPMPPRSKDPGRAGWERERLTLDDLDAAFPTGQARNVGVHNGAPSGNTVDADLDCQPAVALGGRFLPATGWIFGRSGKPLSHYIYRTDEALDSAQVEFTDTDGTMLLELRGNGGLTVFPPSLHKDTGEEITWHTFEDAPADVRLDELRKAASELAAAALLARHWPAQGTRDKAALALTGGLTRAGWDAERVSRFVEAVAEAAGDEEARKRGSKAEPAQDRLESGEKVSGWPTLIRLLGDAGEAVVRRAMDWLGITLARRSDDIPIPEPPPWPDPPGEEAFHGLAGEIVRVIGPASEADGSALLAQSLVAFGNVIGRGAYFTVESDRHHANEFVVLVGRTSKARKGTSWGRVSRLFREAQEQWAAERVQTGLSSGEGLIWSVRDPIKKRERVKGRGEAVRYEEVEADPGVEDKRLLVYEPEFANVLKQTERQGNTLSALLRQAWDGGKLGSLTKNSPARATNAHISLIGHITADELRRYLTQTETANGYGNRHLWICADRSKLLPEGAQVDPQAWEALRDALVRAIDFARTAGEMSRDEEARAIWREVYGPLSEGKPGLAGALLARAEAHVMRLAMLYALLDCSAVIQAPHLLAAMALWDYVERSVYFVFGDDLGDPVADDLLRLLRSCPDGLTRSEIRDYFNRHQSSERIGRALGLLLQHGLVRRELQETGGRPSERWFSVARGR